MFPVDPVATTLAKPLRDRLKASIQLGEEDALAAFVTEEGTLVLEEMHHLQLLRDTPGLMELALLLAEGRREAAKQLVLAAAVLLNFVLVFSLQLDHSIDEVGGRGNVPKFAAPGAEQAVLALAVVLAAACFVVLLHGLEVRAPLVLKRHVRARKEAWRRAAEEADAVTEAGDTGDAGGGGGGGGDGDGGGGSRGSRRLGFVRTLCAWTAPAVSALQVLVEHFYLLCVVTALAACMYFSIHVSDSDLQSNGGGASLRSSSAEGLLLGGYAVVACLAVIVGLRNAFDYTYSLPPKSAGGHKAVGSAPKWRVYFWFVVAYDVATERESLAFAAYCASVLAGIASGVPVCFVPPIFEITSLPTLQYVQRAVTEPAKQLTLTTLLGMFVIYAFALVGFYFFPDQFYSAETGENTCSTLLRCFAVVLRNGLLSGGGIGDYISSLGPPNTHMPNMNSATDAITRTVYDTLFFVIVLVLLLNIIFGIIIDTFSSIRVSEQERRQEMSNQCLVCAIKKDVFDADASKRNLRRGFERHITEEHDVWGYLLFVDYLRRKDKDDYTGIESTIIAQMQNNDLTWVPHLKAMVLDTRQ